MDRGKGMRERKAQFYLVMAAILICVGIYQMVHISGPVMYPDEFGYWANAAQWIGFDWSEVVSLQSYYSFGYSILLAPFLAFIKNPMLMYKAAVLLNMLLVYLHGVLLYGVAMELADNGKRQDWLFCLMAACYPSLLFYMQVTLTESLLSFLYMLSIWLLLSYERTGKIRKGMLFFLVLAYMYFVHMRSLGILTAGIFVGSYCLLKKRQKSLLRLLAVMIFLAILLFLGNEIKDLLQERLYMGASQKLLGVNDYDGQIGKLKSLFTASGLQNFLVSSIGKSLYLGIATCGTIYFGIWRLIKGIKTEIVYGFMFLSVLFTFVITAIYTMNGGRADSFLYGRYNEMVIPILVYMGLCEMMENRYLLQGIAVITAIQGGMACLLYHAMSGINPRGFQGYFVIGISYALTEIMPSIGDYLLYPYVAGSIVTVLLAVVTGFFIRRKKLLAWYMLLFVGLYIYTAASAGNKYLYDHGADIAEDMNMMDFVSKEIKPGDEAVFILTKSDAFYIDLIQFCMREHRLHVIQEGKEFEQENSADFVFTYKNYTQEEILKNRYGKKMETFHFRLYYGQDEERDK